MLDDLTSVHPLAPPDTDAHAALDQLLERVGVASDTSQSGAGDAARRGPAAGAGGAGSSAWGAGQVLEILAPHLREGTVVVDEGVTSSGGMGKAFAAVPAHDLLCLPGGAIGYGLPSSVGAAVAGEGRPVLNLQADGSAMYTISALWTMAREGLDITTVVFNNRSYGILTVELARTLAGDPGPLGSSLLDLGRPDLDFVHLAAGMGVPGRRVTSSEELEAAAVEAFAEPGPHLIEAMI